MKTVLLYFLGIAIVSLWYGYNYRKQEKRTKALLTALVLSVEYVGLRMLRPQEGWTWYDTLKKYYPHVLREMVPGPPMEESNLIRHARRELELLGEEEAMIDGYLRMIQIFAGMGHSGGSASVFVPTLNALLQFQNLKPLTDDPDEWTYHDENMGGPLWQNKRNPAAMSKDGGETYTFVDEEPDPSGLPFVHLSYPHDIPQVDK